MSKTGAWIPRSIPGLFTFNSFLIPHSYLRPASVEERAASVADEPDGAVQTTYAKLDGFEFTDLPAAITANTFGYVDCRPIRSCLDRIYRAAPNALTAVPAFGRYTWERDELVFQ